jgi:hypothetical protein
VGPAAASANRTGLARLRVDHPELQISFGRQVAQPDQEGDVADQGQIGRNLGQDGSMGTGDNGDDQGAGDEHHEHEQDVTAAAPGLAKTGLSQDLRPRAA